MTEEVYSELIDRILTADKTVAGILADIDNLPESLIVENMQQDQAFKNRNLKQIVEQLK